MLYRYKSFLLNNIAWSCSYIPSPHSFYSVPLQSGVWENLSLKELFFLVKRKNTEYNENVSLHNKTLKDIIHLKKAKKLDEKISDKTQNRDMNEITKYYGTFFDNESGNNREEGIKQLESYLKQELSSFKGNLSKIKKDVDDIKKEMDAKKAVEDAKKAVEDGKKAVEDNKNTFFPLITMYSSNIFGILLTIFSICISFKLIDFNLDYLIYYLPEVALPTIITSTVLIAWEYYRLYSKFRRYYKVGKRIYIFCKKKIYSLYKKIYSFYKNRK